eukprot:COSAG05_NODE_1333_length_5152_cov_4.935484_3_plen_60_part_00
MDGCVHACAGRCFADSSAHNVGFRCAAAWDDPEGPRPWEDEAKEEDDILEDLPAWTDDK